MLVVVVLHLFYCIHLAKMNKYNETYFCWFQTCRQRRISKTPDRCSISTNPRKADVSELQLLPEGLRKGFTAVNFRLIRPTLWERRSRPKAAGNGKSLILQGTRIGQVVADVFADGVILAAAVKPGRKAFGMEIEAVR